MRRLIEVVDQRGLDLPTTAKADEPGSDGDSVHDT